MKSISLSKKTFSPPPAGLLPLNRRLGAEGKGVGFDLTRSFYNGDNAGIAVNFDYIAGLDD